jgi:transketolase
MRCLEQIRNDVCYHRADVKIVAVGGGLAYGALGFTHHATEDLAVMRALPGMTVVAPGDPVETALATRAIAAAPGPCYLRLGRAGEAPVHGPGVRFRLGEAIRVREGTDIALVSTGGMLRTAMGVAEQLAARGVEALVLSMHTLKPLDVAAVRDASRETRLVITLEEHSRIGGLGGAVAECLAPLRGRAPLCILGLPPEFCADIGGQEYLLGLLKLSVDGILETIEPLLDGAST